LLFIPFPYKEGDRVAQIYFEKVIQAEFEEVEELSDTERGKGGFGSTGV
jgi:dUTP pyrophosphatase